MMLYLAIVFFLVYDGFELCVFMDSFFLVCACVSACVYASHPRNYIFLSFPEVWRAEKRLTDIRQSIHRARKSGNGAELDRQILSSWSFYINPQLSRACSLDLMCLYISLKSNSLKRCKQNRIALRMDTQEKPFSLLFAFFSFSSRIPKKSKY